MLVALLVGVPAGFLRLGRRARERRIPGSVLIAFEEAFSPATNSTVIEVQLHGERGIPAPGGSRPDQPGSPPPKQAGVASPPAST